MENKQESNVCSLKDSKKPLKCTDCGKEYVDHEKQSFAYTIALWCKEDVCLDCRTYKAAKLELAIEEMAEKLDFLVCNGKQATAVLLSWKGMQIRKTLPVDIAKKLEEIHITYPKVLKDNTCPLFCPNCDMHRKKEMWTDGKQSGFEVLDKTEIYENAYTQLGAAFNLKEKTSDLGWCTCCGSYSERTTCLDCWSRKNVGCREDCPCCSTDPQKSKVKDFILSEEICPEFKADWFAPRDEKNTKISKATTGKGEDNTFEVQRSTCSCMTFKSQGTCDCSTSNISVKKDP